MGPSFVHSSGGFSISEDSSRQSSLLEMISPSSGILIIARAGQEITAEDFSFVYVTVSTTDGSCSSGTSQPKGY